MNFDTRNNLDTSSTARLISYPQPVTKAICVSFWYHMFGNSVGKCPTTMNTHSINPICAGLLGCCSKPISPTGE